VDKDPNLIIVEGRADVINLLRYGYKNVIAVEGATSRIPETVVSLSKMKKTVIAFLDGDHGGDLILKELLSNNVKIDFVARAPVGREVEELTGKEIAKALSNMMPLTQYLKKIQEAEQAIAKNVIAKEEKPIQLRSYTTASADNFTTECFRRDQKTSRNFRRCSLR